MRKVQLDGSLKARNLVIFPSHRCCQRMWISYCDDFWLFRRFSQNCEKRLSASSRLTFCPPHGTTPIPLDGFSWNLIFEDFTKICRENSSFIKIALDWRVFYTKTNIQFYVISRSFLLRMRHVSDKRCRENQNTHFVFRNLYFENRAVY